MDRDHRRGRLAKILEFFGKDIDMGSYDDRLILQKLVYLLQSRGMGLDYDFGWYVRGPYSSSLANDGYILSKSNPQEIEISQGEIDIIREVRESIGCDIKDSRKMEILASLEFLRNENSALSGEGLADKLMGLKPWLKRGEIQEAIRKLT